MGSGFSILRVDAVNTTHPPPQQQVPKLETIGARRFYHIDGRGDRRDRGEKGGRGVHHPLIPSLFKAVGTGGGKGGVAHTAESFTHTKPI